MIANLENKSFYFKIFVFLKKIKLAFRALSKYRKNESFRQNSLFKQIKFLIIRTIYTYPKVRSFKKIKIQDKIFKDQLFEEDFNLKEVVSALDEFGYVKTPKVKQKILNSAFDEITRDANNIDEVSYNDTANKVSKKVKDFKIDAEMKLVVKSVAENIDEYLIRIQKLGVNQVKFSAPINLSENLKKISFSEPLIDVAKSYLNLKEDLSLVSQLFISFPSKGLSDKALMRNAQKYHADYIYKKFFKFFIYLNDVNDFNGPHMYVKKSHKKKLLKHTIPGQFPDEEIEENYKENICSVTGEKGTSFLVDTFGLHKALRTEKDYRIALILTYGNGFIKNRKSDVAYNISKL